MGNVVITLVLETTEDDVTPVVDAAVGAATDAGYVVASARVATDAGETVVDLSEEPPAEEPSPDPTPSTAKATETKGTK
jgi:hypothetical protein